ncbi:hypothetical protein SAMN04488577_1823 [Bacillus sp. cl95]|nr:hypothetical protein SAMN02799634_103192 [Bacillus sp. UNCCL13]SFQ79937.1 hypothetical protein SAMN04488577_1823 [Bacillus sp. cl95]
MNYHYPMHDSRQIPYQPNYRHETNVLRVTGGSEILVQPDKASVTLGAITESKDLKEAQSKNAVIITAVTAALVKIGIKKEQIRTTEYRIDTEYNYIDGKQVFRGYKVTHYLSVEVDDIRSVGKVVDTAVDSGANYVSNVRFYSSKEDEIYLQALKAALLQANKKAETLAGTLNVKLNPVPFAVTEGQDEQRPVYEQPAMFVKGVSTTPIEPGQITIKAIVSARYSYFS